MNRFFLSQPIRRVLLSLTHVTDEGSGFQLLEELSDPWPGPVSVVRYVVGDLFVDVVNVGLLDGDGSGLSLRDGRLRRESGSAPPTPIQSQLFLFVFLVKVFAAGEIGGGGSAEGGGRQTRTRFAAATRSGHGENIML